MVMTRLCRSLFYRKGIHRSPNVSGSTITRRVVSTSQNEDNHLANRAVNPETPKKRPAKTKMKFSDLPEIYMTPTGLLAKPLESIPSDSQKGAMLISSCHHC